MTAPYTAADWVFAVVAVLLLAGLMLRLFVLDEKLSQARRDNRWLTAKVAELESIAEGLSDARHTAVRAQGVSDLVWWVK